MQKLTACALVHVPGGGGGSQVGHGSQNHCLTTAVHVQGNALLEHSPGGQALRSKSRAPLRARPCAPAPCAAVCMRTLCPGVRTGVSAVSNPQTCMPRGPHDVHSLVKKPGGRAQGCIGRGGGSPPPPLRLDYAQLLSPAGRLSDKLHGSNACLPKTWPKRCWRTG